jgi:hypothetical protein
MAISDWLIIGGTALGVLFLADLIFAIDHYLVHHDRPRFKDTHGRHHGRYVGKKDAPQLDAYELSTYNTAGFGYCMVMSVVTLYTGNPGFLLGAGLKWIHSLTFHLYQHRWWSQVPVRKQDLGAPKQTWGIATSHYHAWHHSHPNRRPFTYAETWAGFDRILEMLHPWLQNYTVDARAKRKAAEARAEAPAVTRERVEA